MFGTCILAFSDEAIQEDLSQNFLDLQWLKMAASILMYFLFRSFSSSGYCCISAVATTSLVCARDIFASFTRPESSSRPSGVWKGPLSVYTNLTAVTAEVQIGLK